MIRLAETHDGARIGALCAGTLDLGRLVRRFDHHVERRWEGRRTAA